MTLSRVKIFALRQFTAAFLWIAFQKCVQIGCAFSGLYGNIPQRKLALIIPLLFGGDVWSAFWVGAFTTLVLLPLAVITTETTMRVVAAILQALLAVFGVVSVYLTVAIGTTLDKTVIDIVRLQAQHGSALSFVDSLSRYFTPPALAFIVASASLAVYASLRLADRISPLVPKWRKLWFLIAVLAVFHVTLLPGLKSRKLTGAQLRTWELDRSFPHNLVASWGFSFLREATNYRENQSFQFYFDLSSPTTPSFLDSPPVNGGTPAMTNLILVILESVGAVYYNEDPELMPFFSVFPQTMDNMVSLHAHYTTWPQTTNAIFSILCSEFPHPSAEPISVINPRLPSECLSTILKKAGYRTALFSSQDITFDATHRLLQDRDFDVIYDLSNMPQTEGAWRYSWGLDDRVTMSTALRWALSQPDQPFFLVVQMASGHHPYGVPDDVATTSTANASDLQRYKLCMRFLNSVLIHLYEEIEKQGLSNTTLVAVVSDHGESFGQHPGDFTHGPTIWEPAVWVPATFFGPQLKGVTSRVVNEPTSHIDLAPTLLSLLGHEIPPTMKGRDLTSSRQPRLIMLGARPPASQFGLRDGKYKFIWTLETDLQELFDLQADPFEVSNIAPSHSDLVAVYADIVRRWRKHTSYIIENYAEVVGQMLGSKPQ
jgi:arylsulfatase A-like enzyme